MKKKILSTTVALLLVFSLCFSTLGAFAKDDSSTDPTVSTTKPSEEDKEKEDEELSQQIREEIAKVQAQLDKLKNQTDKIEQYQLALETKVTLLQQEIEAINKEIAPIQAALNANKASIRKAKAELKPLEKKLGKLQKRASSVKKDMDTIYHDFGNKQKALYMNGYSSTLELLLGAEDFGDLLMRIELVTNIAKRDATNLIKLKRTYDKYNKELGKLQSEVARANQLNRTIKLASKSAKEKEKIIRKKKGTLEKQQQDMIDTMMDYSENLRKLYAKQFNASAQVRQLKEIDAVLNGLDPDEFASGVNSYQTTGFQWPVPSCRYISCDYYGYANHNGIDIPASYGANVEAIAGGTVVKVVHQTTSYGNYCIIYHGDGIYSLYAHCSVIKVSEGQSVAQGDVIARVGNSGNVQPKPSKKYPYAGTHLHLGIKKNGYWNNPQNFVSANT